MDRDLEQAIHKVLANEGTLKNAPPSDFELVHPLINYTRAKKESRSLKKAFKSMVGDPQSNLHKLLLPYVPQITPEETKALFESIDKDGLI
jgi:hypothetical protein